MTTKTKKISLPENIKFAVRIIIHDAMISRRCAKDYWAKNDLAGYGDHIQRRNARMLSAKQIVKTFKIIKECQNNAAAYRPF